MNCPSNDFLLLLTQETVPIPFEFEPNLLRLASRKKMTVSTFLQVLEDFLLRKEVSSQRGLIQPIRASQLARSATADTLLRLVPFRLSFKSFFVCAAQIRNCAVSVISALVDDIIDQWIGMQIGNLHVL